MAGLTRLEQLSQQGHIDLFYGDESGVSLLPCVPYGWQFQGDQAGMPSTSGKGVNCFALLSRQNDCVNAKLDCPHFAARIFPTSAALSLVTVTTMC